MDDDVRPAGQAVVARALPPYQVLIQDGGILTVRSVSAGDASPAALFHAAPWRTFRWHFGQRHYSGTYWSATERDHVIYESRLELANLLLAASDPTVHHIVAQPFSLRAEVHGQTRRHIPDYLWDSDDGPLVERRD